MAESSPWLAGLLVFIALILLWRYSVLMSYPRCPLNDDSDDEEEEEEEAGDSFRVEGLTPKPKPRQAVKPAALAKPKPAAPMAPTAPMAPMAPTPIAKTPTNMRPTTTPPSSVPARRPRSPSPPLKQAKPKPAHGIQLRPEVAKVSGTVATRRLAVTPVKSKTPAAAQFQRNKAGLRPIRAPEVK